jgi:hypothetical protein
MVAFILFWIFCILSFLFGFSTIVTIFWWLFGAVVLFLWWAVIYDRKSAPVNQDMLRYNEMTERHDRISRELQIKEEKEARETLFRQKCYASGNFNCDKSLLKFHQRIGDATPEELEIIKMFPELF